MNDKLNSIRHHDKRANIPTNELRGFIEDEEKAPKAMRYPRDPSLTTSRAAGIDLLKTIVGAPTTLEWKGSGKLIALLQARTRFVTDANCLISGTPFSRTSGTTQGE